MRLTRHFVARAEERTICDAEIREVLRDVRADDRKAVAGSCPHGRTRSPRNRARRSVAPADEGIITEGGDWRRPSRGRRPAKQAGPKRRWRAS